MKKNYLVIGCGQIGTRHLQGILKLKHPKNVYGVDPSESSISIAHERCLEINSDQQVTFLSGLEALDQKYFDLAIVATSSYPRLQVIENLTDKVKVKAILLEKVLFPKMAEYQKALDRLERAHIKTWVNCSKRYMPIYQKIKSEHQTFGKMSLHINGGGIGMSCNVIHYIDLVHYFTGTSLCKASLLEDASIFESKRQGYLEIEGTFVGEFEDGSHLMLTSKRNFDPWMITLTTEKFQYLLQEFQKLAIQRSVGTASWKKIEANYGQQSELTTYIVDAIVMTGNSELVTLKESFMDNKVMLECFESFFFKNGIDVRKGCPIT